MVRYWVLIYVPNDTNTSYFVDGFTTDRVSFVPTGLKGEVPGTDDQVLHALNEIAAHDAFAALVPAEFSANFVHQILNYATSERHNANIGIAVRVYSEETLEAIEVDWDGPLPITWIQKTTLKLFKCKFQTLTSTENETYTISFNVTAGDKLILGAAPGEGQNDFEIVSRQFYNR
jgi:hypothetical protein